jgi:hypothetical protein
MERPGMNLLVAVGRRLSVAFAAPSINRLSDVRARTARSRSCARPMATVPVMLVKACAVAVVAMGAMCAATSYAAAPHSELAGAPLKGFLAPASVTSTSASAPFVKEMAVLTNQGISPQRAAQALHVQGLVAQADLPNRLKAAMAGAFAGVWFEPATAQLHVGVTSSAGGRRADGVATGANLAANVTTTPVRSTWAQLLAVQNQWDSKLVKLFTRGQVQTGLEPQHNAVAVTLNSSVPAPERAAIEREASTASVNVIVTVVPSRDLEAAPRAETKCKNFVTFEAYCDKPVTSGVTIKGKITCKEEPLNEVGNSYYKSQKECEERAVVGKEGKWLREIPFCTAGPLAAQLEKREWYVLTAGHCITEEKENWWALNTKAEEGVIGPTKAFSFGVKIGEKGATECGGKCDGGDYGQISIEQPGAWSGPNANNPVFAVTAEWKKKEEKSYPVKAVAAPLVGVIDCHEGQSSGESCGKIEALNVTIPYIAECVENAVAKKGEQFFETEAECLNFEKFGKEGKWERKSTIVVGLVRVEGPRPELISEGGDSGGPFMFIEKNNEAVMEGILSGGGLRCKENEVEKEGVQFFKTEAECFNLKIKEGKLGKWERKERLFYFPVEEALAKLKLTLLTTANEFIPEGPFAKVNGKTLKAGETRLLLATAKEKFTLEAKAVGVSIACTGLTLPEAGQMQIQGLAVGRGVTSKETIEFTGCTQKGNGEPCEIEGGKLKTTPLLNLLGYGNAGKTGKILVLFEPESGSNFSTVKFTGAGCKFTSTSVLGNVVGGAQVAGQPVLAGAGTETLHGEIKFPHVQLIFVERGSGLSHVKASLQAFGVAATLSGVALLLVDEGGVAVKWGVFS